MKINWKYYRESKNNLDYFKYLMMKGEQIIMKLKIIINLNIL